jgi:hypothetical protein
MGLEPVRQFVSKAVRCKARAAFELRAPISPAPGNESNPGRYFELSFACPLRRRVTPLAGMIRHLGWRQD